MLARFGGDVLYVSHSRDEVYRLCQSVCVLTGGKSEPKSGVQALFENPAPWRRRCCRAARIFRRCSVCRRAGAVPGLGRDIAPGPPGIRRDDRRRSAGPLSASGAAGAENTIDCQVVRVVDNVFSTIVMLATPGGQTGRSLLRMELPKEAWAALGAPETMCVAVARRMSCC